MKQSHLWCVCLCCISSSGFAEVKLSDHPPPAPFRHFFSTAAWRFAPCFQPGVQRKLFSCMASLLSPLLLTQLNQFAVMLLACWAECLRRREREKRKKLRSRSPAPPFSRSSLFSFCCFFLVFSRGMNSDRLLSAS